MLEIATPPPPILAAAGPPPSAPHGSHLDCNTPDNPPHTVAPRLRRHPPESQFAHHNWDKHRPLHPPPAFAFSFRVSSAGLRAAPQVPMIPQLRKTFTSSWHFFFVPSL